MLCLYISSNSIIVLILFSPMFLFDSALTQHCYGLQKRVSTTKRNIAHVHKNTNTLSLGNVGTEVYRCNTQFLVKVSFFLTKLTDFFDTFDQVSTRSIPKAHFTSSLHLQRLNHHLICHAIVFLGKVQNRFYSPQ
jgi:hypothetical protein